MYKFSSDAWVPLCETSCPAQHQSRSIIRRKLRIVRSKREIGVGHAIVDQGPPALADALDRPEFTVGRLQF